MCENIFNKKYNSPLSVVILLGATFILIGLILLAFNFGWINPAFKSIIISWPMLLILLAVIGYFKRQRLLPTALLFIGVFFLIPRFEAVYPGLFGNAGRNFTSNFWPLLLIFIGLMLIIEVAVKRKNRIYFRNEIVDTQTATSGENGRIEKDVVFSGSESVFLEPVFKGGNIDAVFGGVVIDLRKTTLPDTTVYLNIDAVFGGVTLYIPEDWCVKHNFDAVFGGYSDKRSNTTVADSESNSKLILQGSLIFSGCNVQ